MKKILGIAFFGIVIIGILILLYSPVIFQEGNPLSQLKGVFQLNFGNGKIVKLSSEDKLYLTKSKNSQAVLTNFMKDKGYEFTEQMGSGYFFEKDNGESIVVTHKYYSRFYSL